MNRLLMLLHYLPRYLSATLCTCIMRLRLRFHPRVEMGSGCRFNGLPYVLVHPTGRLIIGDDVRFNTGKLGNVVGNGQRLCIHVLKGATVRIESGSGISNSVIVARNSIEIGEKAMIGGGCLIIDSDLHELGGILRDTSVSIGAQAFLGAHSVVLKGAKIGQRAIIGAGSLVCRNVGQDETWAGNPIRKLRGSS